MCDDVRPSSIATRVSPFHRLLTVGLMALMAAVAQAADQPASPPPRSVLHLADGRSTPGEIRASTRPGVLRWQAASSGSPSDMAWDQAAAIEFPPPADPPKPTGDFRFELATGDVLFGSLVVLDDQRAELNVPRLGRIHVPRSHLRRIERWRDGADLVYAGPKGLADWKEPKGQRNWREDSGRPMTDRAETSIRGDFGLPARASIEFEISWRSRPEFLFALGVDDHEDTVERAFRFEVWGFDLVIQRELEQQADLAVVQEVPHGPGWAYLPGRAHFQVYLDQQKGRILVFSPGGQKLADMTVAETKPAVRPGLYLGHNRGDVRLDWLRIGRWDGAIPGEVRGDRARIHRVDGSFIDGRLAGWNAASRVIRLETEKGELRIPKDQVSSLMFPVPEDDAPRTIRAVYQDGSRISGEPVKVEDGVLALKVPGIEGPLRLPLAGLRSLVVLRHENPGGREGPGKRP
jgi:hypothetical protein